MMHLLGLTKRTFDRFILKVSPTDENGELKQGAEPGANYLTFKRNPDRWTINRLYFVRGELDRGISSIANRMFIINVRRLYNAAGKLHPKETGMIFALLPWIHRETNIICVNPFEEMRDAIVPLSPKQICQVLGLNPHHSETTIGLVKDGRIYGNLLKTLLNIEITIDGIRQAFCLVQLTKYGVKIIVNPNVVFAGSGSQRENLMRDYNDFINPADFPLLNGGVTA